MCLVEDSKKRSKSFNLVFQSKQIEYFQFLAFALGTYDDINTNTNIDLYHVFSIHSARKLKNPMRKTIVYLQ